MGYSACDSLCRFIKRHSDGIIFSILLFVVLILYELDIVDNVSFFILVTMFFLLYMERRFSHGRIKTMNRELTKKNIKLEESIKLRHDLAHMIIHDMRNPIQIIQGYMEFSLLEKKQFSIETKVAFSRINDQLTRLKNFMENILILAKREAGHVIIEPEETNLHTIIKEVREFNEIVSSLSDVKIVIDLPETVRLVKVDPDIFMRIVDNLLTNAIKHSPKGSEIKVSLTYAGDTPEEADNFRWSARLRVADQGPGVSTEMKEAVFNSFESSDLRPGDRDKIKIGLGLAFCKMGVGAHRGNIYVEDNKPTGAAFVVEI